MSAQQKIKTGFSIDTKTLNAYKQVSLALAGSILMVISAKIIVPFWPVPMTFQPFAATLLGLMLGPRLGSVAVITYLLEGTAGLPVFADSFSHPGLSWLMLPSAGFLLSFPVAAYVAGLMKERGWMESVFKCTALFLVSHAIVYGIGMPWLIGFIGYKAAYANMLMWMPGNVIKIGLGVALTQAYLSLKK